MLCEPNIQIAGENSLIMYFSTTMHPEVSLHLLNIQQRINALLPYEIIDLVVSYGSILVVFDQAVTDHYQLTSKLKLVLSSLETKQDDTCLTSVIELPVYYAIESGPDLTFIAENTGLSIAEVIELHYQQTYQVYAVGFAPGFAYLGEINPKIATSRKATPRLKIPQGSVGIADQQTAIYPSTSPGGWNIIGNCPIKMFDANTDPSMPIQVGDTIRFKPIDKAEFIALGGMIKNTIDGGLS